MVMAYLFVALFHKGDEMLAMHSKASKATIASVWASQKEILLPKRHEILRIRAQCRYFGEVQVIFY